MSKCLGLITLVVCVAALSCICTRAYYLNKHKDFLSELDAALLKERTEQLETERKLHASITDLLEESHERQKDIDALHNERASLIKRLRDPGGASCLRRNATNKNSGSDNETTAGKELSREATEFLLILTRDADKVAEQLRLCQNFLRELPQCVE